MKHPEDIKPYDSHTDKAPQVEQMFDSIAPAYDLMNRVMTLGLYRHWRNVAINALLKGKGEPVSVLDLACGTGDLTRRLHKKLKGIPDCEITGVDLSERMLEIANLKSEYLRQGRIQYEYLGEHPKGWIEFWPKIKFIQADALHLPFHADSFEAITIGYGVRNFQDLAAGYAEMYRVLAPGGRVCVIELCTPRHAPARTGYNLYTTLMIPLLGRLISKDKRAYRYLPESIRACPSRKEMATLLTDAGFINVRYKVMWPDVCAYYIAEKPSC